VSLTKKLLAFLIFTPAFMVSCSTLPPITQPMATEGPGTAPIALIPAHKKPEWEGLASWYGRRFHRRKTANGERFNMHALTAAHRTLPFGSWVCVRNLLTNQEVLVRINDRGPHVRRRNRLIDLSYQAARKLGMVQRGLTPVHLRLMPTPLGCAHSI
jgi:rare lipoprotein A